jgi:hypothetical protein
MTGIDNNNGDLTRSFEKEPTRIVPTNTEPKSEEIPSDETDFELADSPNVEHRQLQETADLHRPDPDFGNEATVVLQRGSGNKGNEITTVLPSNFADDERMTTDLMGEYMAATAVYQGQANDTEALLTAAHNFSVDTNDLPATIASPREALTRNLAILDEGFKNAKARESFFEAKDLELQNAKEFKQNTMDDDLSSFSPYFLDETKAFSGRFDDQLKKVFAKQTEDIKFAFKHTGIVQLTHAISRSLNGEKEGVIPSMFNAIFNSKKDNEQSLALSTNLLKKRLKAKLAIVAKDFATSLSPDEQSIFLLHSIIDEPQKELDEFYQGIFDRALEKIDADAKYLGEDFFNGQYKEGLRTALELELGANRKQLKESEVAFENGNNVRDRAIKIIMAKRLNQSNPLPQVLADLAFETKATTFTQKLNPMSLFKTYTNTADLNQQYQTQVVAPLADNLRRSIRRLDEYHPNTKETVAKVYLDSVEGLAAAKALQVFKAGKNNALDDKGFFDAIVNKDKEAITASLEEHFGADHISNPLRRFFILSKIANDSDFTRRIELTKEEKSKAFKRKPVVRYGLPLAGLSTLTTAAAIGMGHLQSSRDIYGEVSTLSDKANVSFEPDIRRLEAIATNSKSWSNKTVFKASEIIEAGKKGQIIKEEEPELYVLSQVLPYASGIEKYLDSDFISLDFKDSPREVIEELLSQMELNTDFLDGMDDSEKQKLLNDAFRSYESLVEQYSNISNAVPTALFPFEYKDSGGNTKVLTLVHKNLFLSLVKPLDTNFTEGDLATQVNQVVISLSNFEFNIDYARFIKDNPGELRYENMTDYRATGIGKKFFPAFKGTKSTVDTIRAQLK